MTVTKGTVTAGQKAKIKVNVTNSGDLAATPITIKLASSSKQVEVGQVKLNVPAGKTATASITVTATKNARGKATITAST